MLILKPYDLAQFVDPIPIELCNQLIVKYQQLGKSQHVWEWLIYINNKYPKDFRAIMLSEEIVGKNDDGFAPHNIHQHLAIHILAAQHLHKFYNMTGGLNDTKWAKKIIYALRELANSNKASKIPNDVIGILFSDFEGHQKFSQQIHQYTNLNSSNRIELIKQGATQYSLQLFKELINSNCLDLAAIELLYAATLCAEANVPIKAYLLQYTAYQQSKNNKLLMEIEQKSAAQNLGNLNKGPLEVIANLTAILMQQQELLLKATQQVTSHVNNNINGPKNLILPFTKAAKEEFYKMTQLLRANEDVLHAELMNIQKQCVSSSSNMQQLITKDRDMQHKLISLRKNYSDQQYPFNKCLTLYKQNLAEWEEYFYSVI